MHFRTTSFPVCDNGTSGPATPDKGISAGMRRLARADRAGRARRERSWWRSVVTDVRPLQVSAPYRRLFFGNTVAQLGQQMTNVAVAIQVYALTHSSFYVGLVGVFALVPLVVLGLYGGAIADAVDRRSLALVASAGLWAVSIALAVQAFAGNESVWLLYGCIAVQSGFYAINNPARSAMVPRLLDKRAAAGGRRAEHGVVQPRLHLRPDARGAGRSSGRGSAAAYAIDVVTFAAAYYALRADAEDAAAGRTARAPACGRCVDGLRFLKRSPNLRMTFILDLCAMVLAQPRALFPALAFKVYGGGAGVVGLLQACTRRGRGGGVPVLGLGEPGAPAGVRDRRGGAGLRRRGRRRRADRRALAGRGCSWRCPGWRTWSARRTAPRSCRSPRPTSCADGCRACSSWWSRAARGPVTSWPGRWRAARGSGRRWSSAVSPASSGVLTATALSRRFLDYDARHPTP